MILGFDRRYVFLPVVLSLALIVTAFVVVEAGQERLLASTKRIQASQERLALLGNFVRVMTDAETSQRGFLLTNDSAYLEPYEAALKQIEPALEGLRLAYLHTGSPMAMERIRQLRSLAGEKVGEMELTIAYQKTRGPDSGRTLVRTDLGQRISNGIRDLLNQQRDEEVAILATFNRETDHDIQVTRAITLAGTVLNILLVIVAGVLITREIRRRMAAATRLVTEKNSLELEVARRTAELSELSSHLQRVSEQEKAVLARELHDELGGLLIAAKMDISALRRKLHTEDPADNKRWDRVLAALDAGVDLKRRVVEELRPTLLDTMGLYAALRWQFGETCGRAGLNCTERLPENELPLSKEAAIAVFRVAQESMVNIIKHAKASAAHMEVGVNGDELVVIVRDDGIGMSPEQLAKTGASGWVGVRHRVQGLGGSWRSGPGPDGRGTEIEVRLPLDRIQVAPA